MQRQANFNATRSLRAQMPSSEVGGGEEPSTLGPGQILGGMRDFGGCDLRAQVGV